MTSRTASVYFCYAADGTLLYVGQSYDVPGRLSFHGHYSSPSMCWFYYCTRVEVAAALPYLDARAMERAEIARLRPVFNKHHNPAPTAWQPSGDRRRYGSLPEIAPVDSLPTERSA